MNATTEEMVSQTDMEGKVKAPGTGRELPGSKVNAAIARMLSGVRQVSTLWQDDCHGNRQRGTGPCMYGRDGRDVHGGGGGGARAQLLRRYADRREEGVHCPRRVVSMRQKNDHMTRKLQDYLVEEFADGLREDLGLLTMRSRPTPGRSASGSLSNFNKKIDQQEQQRKAESTLAENGDVQSQPTTDHQDILTNNGHEHGNPKVQIQIRQPPQSAPENRDSSSTARRLTVLRRGAQEQRRQRPRPVPDGGSLAPAPNSENGAQHHRDNGPGMSDLGLPDAPSTESQPTPWPHFSQGPSRTALLLREKKIPPMPVTAPPPLPEHLRNDVMATIEPTSDDDVIIAGDPNPKMELVPVATGDDSDADIVPDGIDRKHLPILRSKKMYEKDLVSRLEKKMEGEDQLLGDLRLCMARPTRYEKVVTATRVVQEVIQTSIVRDANGNRIYRVVVDLGKFYRQMKHSVKDDVVAIEGSTFGPTETNLTKQISIQFPATVVMEQLTVTQIGPTVELEVPFKRSEAMMNLVELMKQIDGETEERERRERERREREAHFRQRIIADDVKSDHGSVSSDPVSSGSGSDHLDQEKNNLETTVTITHRKPPPPVRPTRRRRKPPNTATNAVQNTAQSTGNDVTVMRK